METINIDDELNVQMENDGEEANDESELQMTKPCPIGVYVKRDKNGKITHINSEIFLDDLTDWEKIDEGFGDEFAHAQTQYRVKTDSV